MPNAMKSFFGSGDMYVEIHQDIFGMNVSEIRSRSNILWWIIEYMANHIASFYIHKILDY